VSLNVGQELWFVHREKRSGEPRTVKVTRVGRKWAHLDYWGHRIDITTLKADGNGYASPGQCWLNKAAWEAEVERTAAWGRLRQYMDRRWDAPEGVTKDRIEEVLASLPQL